MNYLTLTEVINLVSVRTGSAAIALEGVDIKGYEGKAKVIVATQGGASVVATLQQSDVATHNDTGWADVKDVEGKAISVTPGTTNAVTTVWDINVADLKRYIRVKFVNASTVYVGMVGVKKYPA